MDHIFHWVILNVILDIVKCYVVQSLLYSSKECWFLYFSRHQLGCTQIANSDSWEIVQILDRFLFSLVESVQHMHGSGINQRFVQSLNTEFGTFLLCFLCSRIPLFPTFRCLWLLWTLSSDSWGKTVVFLLKFNHLV